MIHVVKQIYTAFVSVFFNFLHACLEKKKGITRFFLDIRGNQCLHYATRKTNEAKCKHLLWSNREIMCQDGNCGAKTKNP